MIGAVLQLIQCCCRCSGGGNTHQVPNPCPSTVSCHRLGHKISPFLRFTLCTEQSARLCCEHLQDISEVRVYPHVWEIMSRRLWAHNLPAVLHAAHGKSINRSQSHRSGRRSNASSQVPDMRRPDGLLWLRCLCQARCCVPGTATLIALTRNHRSN